MKLNTLRANPAGNITLFVLDPVPPGDRAGLAARLMALPGTDTEQVGYVCPPVMGGAGRLEMAGGEFCGNAARAFGMLTAQRLGGASQVRVEVSGCEGPVTVEVDWSNRTARAEMPLPRSVRRMESHPGILVDLGGIAHLVVETMTPLVKVPAADTLVWEGSCGSGSLAAAVAQSRDDGPFVRKYVQPAGTVEASVTRRNGEIVSAWIGGPVNLDPPCEIEI